MMQMDRGNKDQSPHKKVRSNHDLDFRKSRLLFTSMILLVPAILFIIFWGNTITNKDWRNNLFLVGAGLVILGCLTVQIFEIINKDFATLNLIGFLFLMFGGLLYLLAAIGNAVFMAYHNNYNDLNLTDPLRNRVYDNPDARMNVADGIYWFGLHSLFAFDAIVLAIDCISDLYFAQNLRMLMWSYPLLWTSWFSFGYWLSYQRTQLTWWQLCAKSGFGTIAISILFVMILCCLKRLTRIIGIVLTMCAFLGSVLIWIYFALVIKKYVFNAHDACLYIGIPFLLSGQILFLLYDCLLGTQEPRDGAGAKTVHHPTEDPGNRDVHVPMDARDNRI